MSSATAAAASRYADYSSACPRSQQIIHTMDLTCQQGIFIYDLTFIQQELESLLVSAFERQQELVQQDGDNLKLPTSSMLHLPNGKKVRDFKAERERRRKALGGQVSRKRRMKKSATIHILKGIQRERSQNGLTSAKSQASPAKLSSETNGNSTRPIRSYRPMNFTFPYCYETNLRNGNHLSSSKLQLNSIPYPDQFWTEILTNQHEYLKDNQWNFLEKLLDIDQSLSNNFDYEKEYNEHKPMIHSKEYLFSKDKYQHPELEYSIVVKQNTHLYNLVEKMLNNKQHRNGLAALDRRLKRKHSAISDDHYSMQIDHSVLDFFRRDNNTFSSKYAELQHRLAESIGLERLAHGRAEKQYQLDSTLVELNEIDDKILEITNSIRQRKRPSENAVSFCKPISPINSHSNGTINESEAWRKGRRQSTLRVYDELARLVDERIELEKKLPDNNPSIQI